MLKHALPPVLLLLLSAAHPSQDSPPQKPVSPSQVRALFLANCAQCHGEKGDGEGVTQLDRKARSFLDGGFSYGNTKDAILRSITHGIPGTPMPSFEKALDEVQRETLAQYVIAFGPDQIVVDPSESEMVVKDRPLVVRGKLPALVEGGLEWPRGLAIGTPDGLTFEYRADDVQLVGVRAGRFVNRADWGERGGAALEMLGHPVWTSTPNLNPGYCALAQVRDGLAERMPPRHCRLLATTVHGGLAEIEYVITAGEGAQARSAWIRESCSAYRDKWGSGFVIRIAARGDRTGTYLTVGVWPSNAGKGRISRLSLHADSAGKPWMVVTRWRALTPSDPVGSVEFGIGQNACIELDPRAETSVEVLVLTDLAETVDFSDTRVVSRILQEFGQ